MKAKGYQFDALIPQIRKSFKAALIFGYDDSVVDEYARRIAGLIVPDIKDSFAVAEILPAALKENEGVIADELNALSLMGLLSRFVGMVTDSRSFLSYPRHEYFRRILCNLIGNDVENGYLPAEELDFLGQMVENISYYNAKNFFHF